MWMVHTDNIPIFFCWKEPCLIIGQTLMLRQLYKLYIVVKDYSFDWEWKTGNEIHLMTVFSSLIIICTVCAIDELHFKCCCIQAVLGKASGGALYKILFFTFFNYKAVTIINQKTKRRVWWIFVINLRKHWNKVSNFVVVVTVRLTELRQIKVCCCIDMQFFGTTKTK